MEGHLISEIVPGSIAEEMEIASGDLLLSVNGVVPRDVFDYHYLVNDEQIVVLIQKPDGEQWELEIEKELNEDLGIVFEQALLDEYQSCRNKCIFCFIDQMPPGMRDTLYFKDDDSRLSFLQGNYVTLTNMSEEDIDRIIRFHLAPINVSVHTTNPELRCRMLHNRFAGEALEKMKRLAEAEIEMNSQIVLCKGWNDGKELDKTIGDLMQLYPGMQSLSVVPMGMTKYRQNLTQVEKFQKEDAKNVLTQIQDWQEKCLKKLGTRFVHASDEWFIMADLPIPPEDYYEGYGQLENGVGMVRSFVDEWHQALEDWQQKELEIRPESLRRTKVGTELEISKELPDGKGPELEISEESSDGKEPDERLVSCVTGELFAPTLEECAKELHQAAPWLTFQVYAIRNDFFGEDITVAGLVTAQDIMAQLKGRELGHHLLVPDTMLRSGEEVFLDDYTVSDVAQALQIDVVIVKSSGYALLDGILYGTKG